MGVVTVLPAPFVVVTELVAVVLTAQPLQLVQGGFVPQGPLVQPDQVDGGQPPALPHQFDQGPEGALPDVPLAKGPQPPAPNGAPPAQGPAPPVILANGGAVVECADVQEAYAEGLAEVKDDHAEGLPALEKGRSLLAMPRGPPEVPGPNPPLPGPKPPPKPPKPAPLLGAPVA